MRKPSPHPTPPAQLPRAWRPLGLDGRAALLGLLLVLADQAARHIHSAPGDLTPLWLSCGIAVALWMQLQPPVAFRLIAVATLASQLQPCYQAAPSWPGALVASSALLLQTWWSARHLIVLRAALLGQDSRRRPVDLIHLLRVMTLQLLPAAGLAGAAISLVVPPYGLDTTDQVVPLLGSAVGLPYGLDATQAGLLQSIFRYTVASLASIVLLTLPLCWPASCYRRSPSAFAYLLAGLVIPWLAHEWPAALLLAPLLVATATYRRSVLLATLCIVMLGIGIGSVTSLAELPLFEGPDGFMAGLFFLSSLSLSSFLLSGTAERRHHGPTSPQASPTHAGAHRYADPGQLSQAWQQQLSTDTRPSQSVALLIWRPDHALSAAPSLNLAELTARLARQLRPTDLVCPAAPDRVVAVLPDFMPNAQAAVRQRIARALGQDGTLELQVTEATYLHLWLQDLRAPSIQPAAIEPLRPLDEAHDKKQHHRPDRGHEDAAEEATAE
ncbi:MAG: hypothetical protein AB9M60_10115 [Leptothrix sp. (in: b-proteobacteria)]